jgi:hypothetical protein
MFKKRYVYRIFSRLMNKVELMNNPKERRFYERLVIPGAEVAYRLRKNFNWFGGYNGPVPMKDITKSGICFRLSTFLDRGTPLEIKVLIPGQEPFAVKGDIVWANKLSTASGSFAGVQFKPFGKGRRYNSFKTHEKLEQITRQFSKSE